jgi:hypothetical protein
MLRAAQGRVRCGRCSHVFNALTFLIDHPESDAPPGAKTEETPPDIAPGPNRRASDLPADSGEFATGDIPESSLEFDLTVDDLSRVFVPAPSPSLRIKPKEPPVPVPPSADDTAEHEILDIDSENSQTVEQITLEGDDIQVIASLAPASRDRESRDLESDNQTSEFSAVAIPPPPGPPSDAQMKREIEAAFAGDPATRAEFVLPSGTRLKFNQGIAEVDAESEPGHLLDAERERRHQLTKKWSLASGALALLLVIQLVHFNRDALARSPAFGSAITRMYARLGVKLSPHWDLNAYQLRQWGAAAEPGDSGTLRVRASVFNGASRAQPYPLLRLTLQDRFGGRVGSRDLEPREYLHVPPAGNDLLGAGQRVDADIAIVDPGKDAVGFEIDVCLRDAASVNCAADQPQAKG